MKWLTINLLFSSPSLKFVLGIHKQSKINEFNRLRFWSALSCLYFISMVVICTSVLAELFLWISI